MTGVDVTVQQLMQRLAALPPESQVLIGTGPTSWSFLQATQVNLVGAVWKANAVFLGTPLKDSDVELT